MLSASLTLRRFARPLFPRQLPQVGSKYLELNTVGKKTGREKVLGSGSYAVVLRGTLTVRGLGLGALGLAGSGGGAAASDADGAQALRCIGKPSPEDADAVVIPVAVKQFKLPQNVADLDIVRGEPSPPLRTSRPAAPPCCLGRTSKAQS